MMMAADWK